MFGAAKKILIMCFAYSVFVASSHANDEFGVVFGDTYYEAFNDSIAMPNDDESIFIQQLQNIEPAAGAEDDQLLEGHTRVRRNDGGVFTHRIRESSGNVERFRAESFIGQ